MNHDIPAPVNERLAQDAFEREVETEIDLSDQTELSTEVVTLENYSLQHAEVFDQASQLEARAQVALISKLITHLGTDQIQTVLEVGQREIAKRQRHTTAAISASRQTCLLLKKDYTYQERGLSEPTQYYVYLRRRKPKLDRYIGTLFYIPKGCTLSYFPDAQGRIHFNPPHNVFQLRDSKNPSVSQLVRLVYLEPPPPEYTFTKQQDYVPEIYLRLEYLNPKTHELLAEASYLFPSCMHEGGKLDRYRWEVSTVTLSPEQVAQESAVTQHKTKLPQSSLPEASVNKHSSSSELRISAATSDKTTAITSSTQVEVDGFLDEHRDVPSKPSRRVIELPPTSSMFYLENYRDSTSVLERMRLWVAWSEKAMPQSRWEIVQNGAVHTLSNVSFKRKILSFSMDYTSVVLENSLPALMKWFQDLSLAVSQAQNPRQYSSAQLKLARNLFVDMSLPQDNPLVVLKKLFGVKFSKTLPSK